MFWTIFFAVIFAFLVIKVVSKIPDTVDFFERQKIAKRQHDLSWKIENEKREKEAKEILLKQLSESQISLLDMEKVAYNLNYWGEQIISDVVQQAKFFDFTAGGELTDEKFNRMFKSELRDLFYIKSDEAREAGEKLIKIFNETKMKVNGNYPTES